MGQDDMAGNEVEEYLQYLQYVRAYSVHTLRAYRYDLEQWQAFLTEQSGTIGTASVALARSYVASLRRGQHKNRVAKKTNLSTRSINRRISTLKSFYRYLQKHKKIEGHASPSDTSLTDTNPWQSINLLPEEQRLPNYLSQEELKKLAEACEVAFPTRYLQQLCSALLELGFSTGARVSELCALDFSQVLATRKNPQSALSAPGAGREVTEAEICDKLCIVGKGGKQRFVFLGEHSRRALCAYLKERSHFLQVQTKKSQAKGLQAAKLQVAKSQAEKRSAQDLGEPLFYNSRGLRLQPRSVYALLAQLGKVAGLQRPLHPHLLRHSFATTLLNHGVGIRSVQEFLGHSSLSSTQIYTHVGIQHLREIYRSAHPHSKRLK